MPHAVLLIWPFNDSMFIFIGSFDIENFKMLSSPPIFSPSGIHTLNNHFLPLSVGRTYEHDGHPRIMLHYTKIQLQ